MNPKVSIIVPIYKTEKLLPRCVESLLNQTLKDIEIILVDDGSPDNCPQICDEFAQQDNRIVVVHKKNGGQSSARNAGIEAAKGEYLGYIDSDDYAQADMFEKLYNCAVENDVDFVMSDYFRVSNDEKKEKTLDIRAGLYTKNNIEKEIYPILIMRECVDFGPLLPLWNCLYKSDFIKNNNLYLDEEIKWAEDNIYSAILGYKANSFYYLKNEYLYNYVVNSNSQSTSYKDSGWDIAILMNRKLRDFFEAKKDFDFSRQLDLHILYFACTVLAHLKYANYSFRVRYKVIKKVLNTPNFTKAMRKFKLPKVNVKFKLRLALIKHKQAFLLTLLK